LSDGLLSLHWEVWYLVSIWIGHFDSDGLAMDLAGMGWKLIEALGTEQSIAFMNLRDIFLEQLPTLPIPYDLTHGLGASRFL
jgi:hypothetical protein